jgi:hypothetical protein
MLPLPPLLGVDGPQAANSIAIKTSAPTPTDQKLCFLSILVFPSSGMRSSCAGVDSPSAIPYDSAALPAGLPTTPTGCVMRQPTSPRDLALHLVFTSCGRARPSRREQSRAVPIASTIRPSRERSSASWAFRPYHTKARVCGPSAQSEDAAAPVYWQDTEESRRESCLFVRFCSHHPQLARSRRQALDTGGTPSARVTTRVG